MPGAPAIVGGGHVPARPRLAAAVALAADLEFAPYGGAPPSRHAATSARTATVCSARVDFRRLCQSESSNEIDGGTRLASASRRMLRIDSAIH